MPIDETLKTAKETVTLVGELIKAAGDNPNVKAAGNELGKTALTITKCINNALPPAAVNFAFDKARVYFAERFQYDLAAKAAHIPPEHIAEPKASIAGPALQGLALSHEEPNLKDMYLSLLASAMDSRAAAHVHPAFVEIIRQLTSEEAAFLQTILQVEGYVPVIQIRIATRGTNTSRLLCRHIGDLHNQETGEVVINNKIEALVENWIRLRLVEVDYMKRRSTEEAYHWVDSRPEVVGARATYQAETDEIKIDKGILGRTAFGKQFAEAVGLLEISGPRSAPGLTS
ncbi:MAG: DUF4393 domain-containing protein [Burkholderiales bacterium]